MHFVIFIHDFTQILYTKSERMAPRLLDAFGRVSGDLRI